MYNRDLITQEITRLEPISLPDGHTIKGKYLYTQSRVGDKVSCTCLGLANEEHHQANSNRSKLKILKWILKNEDQFKEAFNILNQLEKPP